MLGLSSLLPFPPSHSRWLTLCAKVEVRFGLEPARREQRLFLSTTEGRDSACSLCSLIRRAGWVWSWRLMRCAAGVVSRILLPAQVSLGDGACFLMRLLVSWGWHKTCRLIGAAQLTLKTGGVLRLQWLE